MRTVGTIVSVKKFFCSDYIKLETKVTGKDLDTVELKPEREYYVPYYQREIRWRKENMISLLRDISRASGGKLLGNMVLDEKRNEEDNVTNKYEIIDGQQRMTSIIMIMDFLLKNSPTVSTTYPSFRICPFNFESFTGFGLLKGVDFVVSDVQFPNPEEDWIREDPFEQRYICEELYAAVRDFFARFDDGIKCTFFNNLLLSEINVIISRNEDSDVENCEKATDFFLDINLKARPLDSEDKFKGYYFKHIKPLSVAKATWTELKKAYHSYATIYATVKNYDLKKAQKEYSFLEMLEHYFRCTLYNKGPKYLKIKFNTSFELVEEITDASLFSGARYIGEHLIEVLRAEPEYISSCINGLTKYLKLLKHMFGLGLPIELNNLLKIPGSSLNSVTKNLIFFEMKNILMGTEVVPKAVLMKYYINVLDGQTHLKKEYAKIHSVYFLGTIYSIFSGEKKVIANIENILKADNESDESWAWLAIGKGNEWLKKEILENAIDYLKYKVTKPESDYQYLAKALAAVYNYYKIDTVNKCIKVTNEEEAEKFISNDDAFSTEHFYINNGNSIKITTAFGDKTFKYSDLMENAARYRNSIFNFIFIPQNINGPLLENYDHSKKIELLLKPENYRQIKCEYSKKVLEIVQTLSFGDERNQIFGFANLHGITEEDIQQKIQEYFTEDGEFYKKFKQFANIMFKIVAEKKLAR